MEQTKQMEWDHDNGNLALGNFLFPILLWKQSCFAIWTQWHVSSGYCKIAESKHFLLFWSTFNFLFNEAYCFIRTKILNSSNVVKVIRDYRVHLKPGYVRIDWISFIIKMVLFNVTCTFTLNILLYYIIYLL